MEFVELDAAEVGMEQLSLGLSLGGLWAGGPANAPHKKDKRQEKRAAECLFINHTTPFLFFSSFAKEKK